MEIIGLDKQYINFHIAYFLLVGSSYKKSIFQESLLNDFNLDLFFFYYICPKCPINISNVLLIALFTFKGEAQIRYFEITDEPPYLHFLTSHSCQDSQKAFCFMAKRGMDVTKCEIARYEQILWLSNNFGFFSHSILTMNHIFKKLLV